jgi:Holliday junction resolvasome RuvABC DNA-binding subunit
MATQKKKEKKMTGKNTENQSVQVTIHHDCIGFRINMHDAEAYKKRKHTTRHVADQLTS